MDTHDDYFCSMQGVTVDCDRPQGHTGEHFDAAKGIYWRHDDNPPDDVK